MAKYKEQLKELLASVGLKKGNIARFATALAVPITFFLGIYLFGNYFLEGIWIANGIALGIALGILLLLAAIIAGYTVIKSLFFVAAELSLLIFLALSYCDVPSRAVASDAALRNLLVLGFVYIGATFVWSLYRISKENYKKVENERWSIKKMVTVALFLVLAGSYVWEVYLVVNPIILNLCIYK